VLCAADRVLLLLLFFIFLCGAILSFCQLAIRGIAPLAYWLVH